MLGYHLHCGLSTIDHGPAWAVTDGERTHTPGSGEYSNTYVFPPVPLLAGAEACADAATYHLWVPLEDTEGQDDNGQDDNGQEVVREDHPDFAPAPRDDQGNAVFAVTHIEESGLNEYSFDVGVSFTHDHEGCGYESDPHPHPSGATFSFTLECSGDYGGCIPVHPCPGSDTCLTEGSDCSLAPDRCAADLNLTCAQNLQGALPASLCVADDLCLVPPADPDYQSALMASRTWLDGQLYRWADRLTGCEGSKGAEGGWARGRDCGQSAQGDGGPLGCGQALRCGAEMRSSADICIPDDQCKVGTIAYQAGAPYRYTKWSTCHLNGGPPPLVDEYTLTLMGGCALTGLLLLLAFLPKQLVLFLLQCVLLLCQLGHLVPLAR